MSLNTINLGCTLITHGLVYQDFSTIVRCIFGNHGLAFFFLDNILNIRVKAVQKKKAPFFEMVLNTH